VAVAVQNYEGARDELTRQRFSNVALLAMRSLEQMVEACAAKRGLHFHDKPRTAHKERRSWLFRNHSDLVRSWDSLWEIYGALGYSGLDGERAKKTVETLGRVLVELARREKIDAAGLR